MVKYFESLSKSQRPKNNKSYETLVKHHTDERMLLKFQSFLDISNVLLPCLKQFQTDAPMMPFVSDALEAILRRLMKMILRSQEVDEAITPLQLIKIDLEKNTHFLPLDALKLPTATKAMLQPLKGTNKREIQMACVNMIKGVISKLQERSPLSYLLIRCLSCLIPSNMVTGREECIVKFNKMVEKLYQKKHITIKSKNTV